MEREKSHYTQRTNKVKHRFLIGNNGNQEIIHKNSDRKRLQFKICQSPTEVKFFFPDTIVSLRRTNSSPDHSKNYPRLSQLFFKAYGK